MIPYFRRRLSDLYTLSQSKLLENHTLHSGTYLYSPYMAVPTPPPPPPQPRHTRACDLASSFPFSLEGEKKKFLFSLGSYVVNSPILHLISNYDPFHSSIFHGITCGQGIIRGTVKIPWSRNLEKGD